VYYGRLEPPSCFSKVKINEEEKPITKILFVLSGGRGNHENSHGKEKRITRQ